MACSRYISTKETTHAARVSRLLLDPCTDLFRDILRNHVTEIQFPGILQQEKSTLYPILNRAQREKLYPTSSNFTGTYDEFDISLLYILLRNISGITPHQKGWGKLPNSSDRSLSANIDRIREIRNIYCGHAVSVSLADAEFRKLWQDISVIISELEGSLPGGCTRYSDAAKMIQTVTMDPEQEKKFLDMIDQQHEFSEDLRRKFSEITINLRKEQVKINEGLITHNVKLETLELQRLATDVDITELEIKQEIERTELENLKYEQDKQRTKLNDISTNLTRLERLTISERTMYETTWDDGDIYPADGEKTWNDDEELYSDYEETSHHFDEEVEEVEETSSSEELVYVFDETPLSGEVYYVIDETPSSGEVYYVIDETPSIGEVYYVFDETPSSGEVYYLVDETSQADDEVTSMKKKPSSGKLNYVVKEAARGTEELINAFLRTPLLGNLDNIAEETARTAARGAEKFIDFLKEL